MVNEWNSKSKEITSMTIGHHHRCTIAKYMAIRHEPQVTVYWCAGFKVCIQKKINEIFIVTFFFRIAVADIQEFYELTLLDDSKSIQQKTAETNRIANKWEATDGPISLYSNNNVSNIRLCFQVNVINKMYKTIRNKRYK